MEIFTTKSSLSAHLGTIKASAKRIGLVPTMGALHNGHLELIKTSLLSTDCTVCSIFVNPTQFNNPDDLKNYPKPTQDDILKLRAVECDVLFLPSVDEMYTPGEQWNIDLGNLEHILEGKFRPGHYRGVTQIVYKLFDAVKPDTAFFGQKDYQQFKVIARMVEQLGLPFSLVMCPIVREADGLAMSSRNVHLSAKERKQALALSMSLALVQQNLDKEPIEKLKQIGENFLNQADGILPEYFELCDGNTLAPAGENSKTLVALVAARVGNTRLIDNVILKQG